MVGFGILFFWILLCSQLQLVDATSSYHLNNVLSIIEELEGQKPAWTILNISAILCNFQISNQDFRRLLLGETSAPVLSPGTLSPTNLSFLDMVMNHQAGPLTERGVVLTPDGTTVAVGNLMAGIEAGLKNKVGWSQPVARRLPDHVDNLYTLTLAKDLGLAFLSHHTNGREEMLGHDGCWDDVDDPSVFTRSGTWTPATAALINGGMDGFLLGNHLTHLQSPLPKLSVLLRDYYSQHHHLLPLKASSRKKNFEATFDLGNFTSQVLSAVSLYDHLRNNSILQHLDRDTFREICERGVKEFHRSYLECPTIIPRCMWAARPFRGEPVSLALPLAFVYIHHTFEPSQPCTNFQDCAGDMRSIQRFHQDVRQWNDIGYKMIKQRDALSSTEI
ncbi:peptidoglycan recognition protein 6 isoform X2 [Narcine bancroftii]|uniref:peptidoglycan recognition protein 6 isoform X2 n=1 Tax=Narcine bancroftii TaxID=1343680 RepID=UPI0038312B4C